WGHGNRLELLGRKIRQPGYLGVAGGVGRSGDCGVGAISWLQVRVGYEEKLTSLCTKPADRCRRCRNKNLCCGRFPRFVSGLRKNLHPVSFPLPRVRTFQVLAGLVDGALSVVPGLDRLTIFVDRTGALSCDIKDLAQPDMAPDFRPA